MRTAQTVLTVIQERGKQHKPIERVYKLLFNRDLYLNAYAKLYPNNGAMTKGVTEETVDGMSIQKIDRMIELLREEKYQWKPARREYIPKKNGKKRPLGIPTWGDKLLQEVMREILEAYYEPQFSTHSHGFRPNKGCHTALQEIQVWKGNALLHDDDLSIVQRFQQEYRGLVQYYVLAQNLSWFSKLYWIMETSLLKTLACKHRSSIKKQKAKYKTTTTSTSGKTVHCLQVVVERPGKKPLVATWGGISLAHKRKAVIEDTPYKVYGGRTELIKRLTADTCELCGSSKDIEVHHIRKLADLKTKGKSAPPVWVQIMAARQRKTLVVCRECHTAIHNGTLNIRS